MDKWVGRQMMVACMEISWKTEQMDEWIDESRVNVCG